MGKANSRIFLLMLIFPSFVLGGAHPRSAFSLSGGLNSFSSNEEDPWGINSGYFGRVEFLQRMRIPIGFSLSLGYNWCFICDETGSEYVASYSMVAQIVPPEYPVQVLTGIGYSKGNDQKRNGSKGAFQGLNIPLIVRLLYKYNTETAYLAFGGEFSLELNNTNNVIAFAIPIQWGAK